MRKRIEIKDNCSEKYEKIYDKFEESMALAQAVCRQSLTKSSQFGTFMSSVWNGIYYMFSSKTKQKGELFMAEINSTKLSKFWNMLDHNKYMRYWFKKLLPSVEVKQNIFVPKLLEPLTISDLANKIVKEKPGANKEAQFLLKQHKYDPSKLIKIRILSNYKLPIDFATRKIQPGSSSEKNNDPLIKNILVHIHGGGFIGLSSRSHQNYLRKWAKMLPNTAIFSIDYRLSPQFVYPDPVDDIWQGYYWILTQCESQLGIKPEKILLAGDSAGGNFAMVLALRALHSNVRMPDGIILGYPGIF